MYVLSMGNSNSSMDVKTSSSMDVVTTYNRDVEAQQYIPQWFVDHEHMLRPNQEREANKLGYFILKVPKYMRQPPQDFSPQGWQFGLHNREDLDSNGSEAIKLAIAVQYGLVGEKWVHFRDAIVDDPKAMLACYGLHNGITKWRDEHIKHVLALDALFLADYIDTRSPKNERRLWTKKPFPSHFLDKDLFLARYDLWVDILNCDLHQVENQIPFVLIDKVVEYISNFVSSPSSTRNKPLNVDLQYQHRSLQVVVNQATISFDTSSEAFKNDNSNLCGEKTHILGALYKTICGSKGLLMKKLAIDTKIRVPSATKLKQSRIKIVGVDGPLCTMSYKNQSLCLPKVKIYDSTISFIRNMAWYECKNTSGGCVFNNYITLMMDLIQAPEDLDLLIKCGVIYNSCGMKAFEMWTSLNEGIVEMNSSQIHRDMKVAIVSRCHHRRYRLWSEFKIVFCSRPWLVLSTIIVVLVTMATLVQTYIAIIGSNKMKPKFP